MTNVKECMTPEVEYVEPNTNIVHIARLMKEQDCGSIPVAENDKLVGFVTDRDIVMRCIAADKDPVMCVAKDIMTPKILYCYETDTLEDVAHNMAENQVRRLPVMNKDKRLVGIVSLGDVSHGLKDKKVCGEALDEISAAA